jgi:hypothetical protein
MEKVSKESATEAAVGIKITPEMLEAGEREVWASVGGAEGLGGYFSARDLASAVYVAMERRRARTNSTRPKRTR